MTTTANLNGDYYLVATACDSLGNCTTKSTNVFKLDSTTPTATIAITNSSGGTVANGSTVNPSGTYTVTIGCTSGVSKTKGYSYTVKSGSTTLYSGTSSTFNIQPSVKGITDGTINITATCTNNAGTTSANANATLVAQYPSFTPSSSCGNQAASQYKNSLAACQHGNPNPSACYNGDFGVNSMWRDCCANECMAATGASYEYCKLTPPCFCEPLGNNCNSYWSNL